MIQLLQGAGEIVMWSIAVTLGIGVAAIGALWAWDKYSGWRWERRVKR